MNTSRKLILTFIALMLLLSMLPAMGLAASENRQKIGNSDLNIQNGGLMLSDGDDFYFVDGGIFLQRNEEVIPLCAGDARNLNLYENYIYFSISNKLFKIPSAGGQAEEIFEAPADIVQMYVVDGSLRYISQGRVFELSEDFSAPEEIGGMSDVLGLIPTAYGDLLLTGEHFDYTVWANGIKVLTGVTSCYTDSGYLAVLKDGQNYMAELSNLFSNFNEDSGLMPFEIHGQISLMELLDIDIENSISEDNDNNELMMDFTAILKNAGMEPLYEAGDKTVSLFTEDTQTVPALSQGQKNIVKRARQLHEIEWTPLEDRYQWGYRGVFKAETTYTGLPYGQPVNSNGYVGYGVSLETFAASILDNTSKFYTSYSEYNKIAPVYSTDCSGYLSYTWGLSPKATTYSIPNYAEKIGDKSIYSLQVGDCLNDVSSHVVLVSDLTYDSQGQIIGVVIMEQTPVITKLTRYGQGESRSLASLQSYYLNGGYSIYRNPKRDEVTYTPNPAVPLDGEKGSRDPAPKSKTSSVAGGKTVELYNNTQSPIYYTTDGSDPSVSGKKYTGAITIKDTTKLRAVSVSGNYSGSSILEYTVKVPQADTPKAELESGNMFNGLVSSGSKIKLTSSSGVKIYYTTDGTEPTSSSTLYSLPITITKDMTIKAIALGEGYKQSAAASLSFKIGKVYTINASTDGNGSISPSGTVSVLETGSKEFKITPISGYAVSDVLVNGASVGAVSSYTFSNVTGNQSIYVSFKSSVQIPFTDVSKSAWYYEAVSFAYGRSLFNGVSSTSFAPDSTMNRGMFVTVLGRYGGVSSSLNSGIGVVNGTGVNIRSGPSTDTEVAGFVSNKYTAVQVLSQKGDWYEVKYGTVTGYIRNDLIKVYNNNYTDLKSGQYYSPYAEWACLTGVASGTASGSFSAENDISREHMCLMLYNYTQAYGKTLPKVQGKVSFTDDSAISANAKTAVYALYEAGIINGMGDGSFSPQGNATRAQVAQIFMKLLKALG